MKNNNTLLNLKKSRNENKIIKISYDIEEDEFVGIVINYSDSFVLLAEYFDFIFKNYRILKIEYIKDISFEKTYNSILNKYIDIESKKDFADIKLENLNNIFRKLHKNNIPIFVTSGSIDKIYFKLGLINSIYKMYFKLKSITTSATWEKTLFTANHNEIISISFGSKYNDLYYKCLLSKELKL